MSEFVRTSCTRDCPDACGLVAEVAGDRVVGLRGDADHPITRGFLCYRVGTHYLDRLHSVERLTRPLLRRGDRWQELSFEAALDHAAGQIDRIRRESGPAALLHTQGGGSLGILKTLNAVFSRLLGASETRGEVCDGAGTWAQEADFGIADANDLEDVSNARGVILWGKNVANSSPHAAALLNDVRRAGVPVWLIDPLPTRVRAIATRHIQPRPGGDAALALGVARAALDAGLVDPTLGDWAEGFAEFTTLVGLREVAQWEREADVPAGTAADLAAFLSERAPVTSLIGWGLQRRANGATQVRAIDALHALTGNLGRPGAGASFTTRRKGAFDLSLLASLAGRVPRTLLLPMLGAEIERAADPPIRGVFIDNHNPVATNPDSAGVARALRSREFVMVIDSFLTDTAQSAQLVLPGTMMLEEDDLVGSYGHHRVSACRPVARRPAGTHTDLEIYQGLAQRLGFGEALAGTPQEWMTRLAGRLIGSGISMDELLAGAPRDPAAARVAFEGRRFATPTGRFRFVDRYVGPSPDCGGFPLQLLALSTGRWQASQLTAADEQREGALEATLHPMSAPGFANGDRARLQSRIGDLEVVLRFDPAFRRDTVYVPRARSLAEGRCVNLLVEARLTDHGDSAAFYDQRVRLVPIAT